MIEIVNKISEINDKDSIDQEELFRLRSDSAVLEALYAAGVDNWEGYSHAMEILNE